MIVQSVLKKGKKKIGDLGSIVTWTFWHMGNEFLAEVITMWIKHTISHTSTLWKKFHKGTNLFVYYQGKSMMELFSSGSE